MMYAYGQTGLHPETARHCNFQIIGGRATGTYALVTGYYGLTAMPPEFQKMIDKLLHKIRNTFAFIDDFFCHKGDIRTIYQKSRRGHENPR